MYKGSFGERLFDKFNIVFLGLLGLIMLFPYWNVIMTSLVGKEEYYSSVIILFPKNINFSAYSFIFGTDQLISAGITSVLATLLGTVYDMFLLTTVSYGLSRKNLPGRNFFLLYFLATMYFNGGLIPYYLLVSKYLNLSNSILAISITAGLNVAWFIILKNFFKDIPESLAESAKIDGANEVVILFRIILPLSMPALATLTLFSSVVHWNEWFKPLLFMNDERKYTLQLLLRRLMQSKTSSLAMTEMTRSQMDITGEANVVLFDEAIKMAILTITTVPIICVYPFLQKYFAKGIMIGSIKA